MPFYEYRRPDGTTFEVMQKMSDPPLEEDPETGVPVTRVFHPIAVHFKGKGFYSTDYGKSKRAGEQAETGGDGDAKKSESSAPGAGSKAVQKLEAAKAEAKSSTSVARPKPKKNA
ncbi:MAG TPA: hypothetical protein VG474_12015 [Solirubrobacteraceae bacterium]|nr:hypothetical protein [Solirubrobacteraceae bacterium]